MVRSEVNNTENSQLDKAPSAPLGLRLANENRQLPSNQDGNTGSTHYLDSTNATFWITAIHFADWELLLL